MKLVKYISVLLVYLMAIKIQAHNILGVLPLPYRSHNFFFQALMKGLAKRGHHVDVISHYETTDPPKNYRTIFRFKHLKLMKLDIENVTDETIFDTFKNVVKLAMVEKGNAVCELLADDKIQQFIKDAKENRTYDLILTEIIFLIH